MSKSYNPHPMNHFEDHDDQDLKDLAYGAQMAFCKALASEPTKAYEDASITKSWTPDED